MLPDVASKIVLPLGQFARRYAFANDVIAWPIFYRPTRIEVLELDPDLNTRQIHGCSLELHQRRIANLFQEMAAVLHSLVPVHRRPQPFARLALALQHVLS